MTTEEKIAKLEEIMDLDEGSLHAEDELSDIEEWDSLSKLSLIVLAKQKFAKSLSANEIRAFVTVSDILNYLA